MLFTWTSSLAFFSPQARTSRGGALPEPHTQKWFALRAPEVQIWIKWFALRAPEVPEQNKINLMSNRTNILIIMKKKKKKKATEKTEKN